MTSAGESPVTDRDILLSLRSDDWVFLHGREKHLAKPWAQALKVHAKMIVFNDRFPAFLAAKVAHSSATTPTLLIATLKLGLQADEANADDRQAYRATLPARILQILDLPSDRFPHPERFTHEGANHSDAVDSEEAGALGPGELEGSLGDAIQPPGQDGDREDVSSSIDDPVPLAVTVDAIEQMHAAVMEAATALLNEIAAGRKPASRDAIDLLSNWYDEWANVPSQLATVIEARAMADLEASRTRTLADDAALVASLASMTFSGGSGRAIATIAALQAELAQWPLELDEASREDLTALRAVLQDEWPSDRDMQLVGQRFGNQILMAAGKLTPIPSAAGEEQPQSPPTIPALEEAQEPSPREQNVPAEHSVNENTPQAQDLGNDDPFGIIDDLPHMVTDEPASRSVHGLQTDIHPINSPDIAAAPLETVAPQVSDEDPADESFAVEARSRGEVALEVNRDDPADVGDYLPRFEQAAGCGDFGLAYWYAVAGQDEIRALAARLLVLATSSEMAEGSPHPRANAIAARLGDLSDASAGLRETVAAALVPAALLLPPYSEAALSLNSAASRLGNECPAVIRISNTLTYERGSGLHTLEAPQLLAARDQARADLNDFRDRAPSRTMRFNRATEVWRELIRQQGTLGSLAARALAQPTDAALREELAAIDERAVERIIKDTDQQLNPMQAKREAIIAGAKQELTNNIERYVDLLRALVAAEASVRAIDRGASGNTGLISELLGALSTDADADAGPNRVTAGVADWLRSRLAPDSGIRTAVTERELLARPVANAFEIARTATGEFDPSEVTVALLDATQARTSEEAFAGYVTRHDFVGLGVLLEGLRSQAPASIAGFEERERRAKSEARETLQRALERTRIGLSRALSATSLSDVEAQSYQDKVERIGRDANPHFPEALATLAQIDDELTARHQKRLDDATARLDGLTHVDGPARERVATLIAARDLLSAEEFLAQLSNGATSLPEEDAQDRTLEEFWAVAHDAADTAAGINWFGERLRAGRVGDRLLPHPSAPQRIQQGLLAWDELSRQGRRQGFDRLLGDVLSAVGFQRVKTGQRFSPGRVSTSNVFEAQYDGYALTPTFGSAARGRYAIYLCWERKTVDGLLQAVRAAQETQSRPTVVLYFQTLRPADRRMLAEQCRRKGLPNIVIDHAAMMYLGTQEEARLDALMHVCLPFTGSNPYTPFVLGDVPREMFYGRRDELRAVQDPSGSLFVYGGRQLGKSALLKTAKSEFDRIDDQHVSIYLDLKAEGIGEWHRADDLWRVLLPHLQATGVASDKVSKQANPDVIVRQISDWLAEDDRRHLLLLLDESDAFVDQDSQPRDAGKGQFKNVYMLKNLMNQSQRRFKPVFAGLHQVQRFHKESNGPMAHVGTEIPIGPLPPAEAYKLVVRPLEAIGYRFTNPDVVWRLLSHTNYQASLIQLFCQELVNDLKTRRLALAEPPSPIDGATVDRVYENRELRGQIAQRFDWTIQLDNRYRVIALVAAWLNLADDETVVPVPELRAQCSDFWPVGFDGVSPDEFRALLDEMVGLGVLVRSRNDHYGIRSPNVIRLLGSKDDIERKLLESASLELPTVFDPTRYRRRLSGHTRSPLTEAQAARMLSNATEPTLIVASSALGADRLVETLTEISNSGEGVELFARAPHELTPTLTGMHRMRKARHVFLDARGIDRAGLESALTTLARTTRNQSAFTASVLLDPADRVRLDLPDTDVRELTLEPWTDIELRAVEPEADVSLGGDVRTQLLDLTGGWPDVLEPVLEAARRTDVTAMLSHAKAEAQKVIDQGWDAFAAQIGVLPGGVEDRVLRTLLEWGEPVGRNDLAELLPMWEPHRLTDALDALGRSGAVQTVDGPSQQPGLKFRVNPLVARTIQQAK